MSSRNSLGNGAGLALLTGLVLASMALGQNCDCQTDCCPPYFKYRFEGAPKIKFKHGCPKPICDPCRLPHFGVYQPCWQPWPFPPNWTHCAVPPPAALVPPIPPKRFRGEPIDDKEKEKEKEAGKEAPPSPRRLDGSALPQFLPASVAASPLKPEPLPAFVPLPSKPDSVSQAGTFSPLPADPASKAAGREGTSAPLKPLLPAEPAASDPLAPAPLKLLPPLEPAAPERQTPPPVMKPLPPIEPAMPDHPPLLPMEKRKEPAGEPMPIKTLEQPAPIPASLAVQAAEYKTSAPQPAPANSSTPAMRMVNSRRVLLDYDMKDLAGSEQSVLELWYTQDGRQWHKDTASVKSGAPYVVEVNKEGTYGFTMVARGAAEKSTPPPSGELPQVWVEVDWTKPLVNLIDARAGPGPLGRSISLVWTATDNNLASKPITLSYSEQPHGPWKTFAGGLENTGRYVWQVPNNVPANVYVRLEACDLVGNTAATQTMQPVQLP